ncbi:MAG TPA: response regulator transcription factor [Candidatus Sulfotelmatobacter sp.]|nr:response regulator transcription factor [Candidatus Sulfotelmatobacter sp.]
MSDYQPAAKGPIRVLVAEDSRIYTRLLSDALKRDSDLQVIPFESDSRNLSSAIKAQRVDVFVVSSTLDGQPGKGIAILRELHTHDPSLRVLVLLDSSSDETIVSAFRAGARGVFSKHEPIDLLSRCIHCIHEGQIWANSRELTIAIEALASAPAIRTVNAKGMNLLSKRELQILRSLAEGLTNQEIAERLNLSRHTVKNYLFRMFDKLGVSSRVELLFMTMGDNNQGGMSDLKESRRRDAVENRRLEKNSDQKTGSG